MAEARDLHIHLSLRKSAIMPVQPPNLGLQTLSAAGARSWGTGARRHANEARGYLDNLERRTAGEAAGDSSPPRSDAVVGEQRWLVGTPAGPSGH